MKQIFNSGIVSGEEEKRVILFSFTFGYRQINEQHPGL